MTTRWLFKGARALKVTVALSLLLIPSVTFNAATARVDAEITRTLTVSDDRWGGCAVRLSVSPSEEGLNCSDNWVSFSCTGDHASKSNAARMFDSAQMAFALGREVRVWVDDTKTHNGFCFVNRIDVLP